MPGAGAGYSHLHQLLIRLKEVRDKLTRGPRQIQVRRRKIEEAQAVVVQKEAELKEIRAASDRKNLELRSKEVHLEGLQTKLNQATSNKEFDIIRGQMQADNAAKAVLEDEVLESLDRADALQAEIVGCNALIGEMEDDARSFANDFEKLAVTLHEQERQLQAAISDAEGVIPGPMKEQYRRLVDAYGADGMASVEKGVCNHCFVNLTPQLEVVVQSGKLIVCHSCGRLLYPSSET
ncbi:MAG: hypothetical protein KDA80_16480 [Planctomycetaceae bacterium]|nr:hypothetical protein [Planctomycetaceae bacterium]